METVQQKSARKRLGRTQCAVTFHTAAHSSFLQYNQSEFPNNHFELKLEFSATSESIDVGHRRFRLQE